MTIIKIQVPLAVSRGSALPLIYDKAREHEVMQPIDAETAAAMKTDAKGYFEGAWDAAAKRWTVGRRVARQPW